MERTFVIIKPDAVQRGLIGSIIQRFERKGLQLAGAKFVRLDATLLASHYAHIADKPFFPEVAAFMSSAPVMLLCLEGVDAISTVRAMGGVTKARAAAPGTIRGDFAMSVQSNVVHTSEDASAAAAELARFFRADELLDYELANRRNVYASYER
jgi:nucleoside-diphosphate kinase